MNDSTTSKTDLPGRIPGDADNDTLTAAKPRPKPVGRRSACSGCGRAIADRFLLYAMDRHWHVGCLRCSVCQMPLDDAVATCYTRAGLILCRADYVRYVFHRGQMFTKCSPSSFTVAFSDELQKKSWNKIYLLTSNLFPQYLAKI